MSKNLTRKGLALGAAFALVATAMVSTPALAADGVVLKANTGTSLAVPVTETLTLNASLVPSLPAANIAQLKYKIVTDGSFVAKAVITSGSAVADAAKYTTTAGDDTFVGEDAFVVANISKSKVLTPATTPSASFTNKLALSVDAVALAAEPTDGVAASATTPTKTATVTAWIDSNLDGVVDAAEASQTVTVSFLKYSEITGTPVIAAAYEADATVSAKLAFTNINNEQLAASSVGAKFTSGTDTALTGAVDPVAAVALTAATSTFDFVTTGAVTGGLVKATAVKVQPTFKTVNVGTAATASVVSRTIATFAADTVESATTAPAAGGTADVALNSTYQAVVVAEDADEVAVAGAAVAVKITSPDVVLSATKTVAVNGVVYTSNAALPGATGVASLATTTNADGKAFVTITTTGFANGNDVVVEFKAENFTATLTTNNANASYKAYVDGAVDAVQGLIGTATAVKVIVRDQFGGTPANNKYQVRAAFDDTASDARTTKATVATNTFANVVDGSATLSISDNGTGAGSNKYDLALVELAVGGGDAASVAFRADFPVKLTAAALAPGAVAVTIGAASGVTVAQNATTKVYTGTLAGNATLLALATLSAYDDRTSVTAAPAPAATSGALLSGTVTTLGSATSAALAIAAAPVTISGAGLMFSYTYAAVTGPAGAVAAKTVYGVGSLTGYTNATGGYSFTVWSNNSGKQTVTITSGAGSATVVLDSFAPAAAGTATALVVDAPASVKPGSTLTIKAKLTDKYGNGVNTVPKAATAVAPYVLVSYTGPGLLVSALPTETDANGEISFGVFLGANDSGTATVTVSYSFDADENTTDDDDIVVQKSIVIGAIPAAGNSGDTSGWTSRKADNTVKMYAKNLVGVGKVVFMHNGSEVAWVRAVDATDPKLTVNANGNYLVRTRTLLAGKNTFEIWVDGERVSRTAYTK